MLRWSQGAAWHGMAWHSMASMHPRVPAKPTLSAWAAPPVPSGLPKPCSRTHLRALKQMLQTWGIFLLSFVLRLSSCAASCPVIYSCQPVPRGAASRLLQFGVVYPQPQRSMEVEGGWWAPVAPGADRSHSSPAQGKAVGAPRCWVHVGFSWGGGPGFLPGHSFATGWVLPPPCAGCPDERATVPGGCRQRHKFLRCPG